MAPDSATIAVRSADPSPYFDPTPSFARMYSIDTGTMVSNMIPYGDAVQFTPDGRWLIAAGPKGWGLVSVPDGRMIHEDTGQPGDIYSLCVAESGNLFATGNASGDIRLWDLRGFQLAAIRSLRASRLLPSDVRLLQNLSQDSGISGGLQQLAAAAAAVARAFAGRSAASRGS